MVPVMRQGEETKRWKRGLGKEKELRQAYVVRDQNLDLTQSLFLNLSYNNFINLSLWLIIEL